LKCFLFCLLLSSCFLFFKIPNSFKSLFLCISSNSLFIKRFEILFLRVICWIRIFFFYGLLLFKDQNVIICLLWSENGIEGNDNVNVLIFVTPISLNELSDKGKWHHLFYLLSSQRFWISKKCQKKVFEIHESPCLLCLWMCSLILNLLSGRYSRQWNFKSIVSNQFIIYFKIHLSKK